VIAIINPVTNKLHKLTFSKTLAELIIKKCPEMEIRSFNYHTGKVLDVNEKSKTGLYGIVSSSKNYVLRISCQQEFAELVRDDSRYISEIHLS